jgi:NAD+ diphosphatase
MLGFTAEYESGELKPDGKEILEAQWFEVRDLPLVPPASTISAQLIRNFVEQKGKAYS